jgi:hypothetical protein
MVVRIFLYGEASVPLSTGSALEGIFIDSNDGRFRRSDLIWCSSTSSVFLMLWHSKTDANFGGRTFPLVYEPGYVHWDGTAMQKRGDFSTDAGVPVNR